ncbi:MAG: RNA polymerase sigma factor [Eubacteriales bacterium]|nr:RNA polymerase sigma factor [Eubacteriales bacterium]
MDEQRFTDAVRQYQRLLLHISYTMLHNEQDCADVVQQALLNAWRARGRLRQEQAVKSWLARIVVNECNSFLRKRGRMRFAELSEELPCPPQVDNLPLHDALEKLPPRLRMPIVLSYLEGFTNAEIASTLHIPEGTVKSRMSQGRKQLCELLSDDENGGYSYDDYQ